VKDGKSIRHFAFDGSVGKLEYRSVIAANDGWLWQMDPGVMDETLTVPAELHRARNEVIRYAISGGEPPKELELLKQWFSEDQAVWDNLHSDAAGMSFSPAVSTRFGHLYRACDSELREHFSIDEDAVITDELRVSFVRELLSEDWSIDNYAIVGIGQRWIENELGQGCYIGYTEELEGQAGLTCYWQGVFADEGGWHNHLRNEGYILADDLEDLPDEALLLLYRANA
jgi:hypothetical protein